MWSLILPLTIFALTQAGNVPVIARTNLYKSLQITRQCGEIFIVGLKSMHPYAGGHSGMGYMGMYRSVHISVDPGMQGGVKSQTWRRKAQVLGRAP